MSSTAPSPRPIDSINVYLSFFSRLHFDYYLLKIRDQNGSLSQRAMNQQNQMPWVSVTVQPRLLGWFTHLTTGESQHWKVRPWYFYKLDTLKSKCPGPKKENTRRPSLSQRASMPLVVPIVTEKQFYLAVLKKDGITVHLNSLFIISLLDHICCKLWTNIFNKYSNNFP